MQNNNQNIKLSDSYKKRANLRKEELVNLINNLKGELNLIVTDETNITTQNMFETILDLNKVFINSVEQFNKMNKLYFTDQIVLEELSRNTNFKNDIKTKVTNHNKSVDGIINILKRLKIDMSKCADYLKISLEQNDELRSELQSTKSEIFELKKILKDNNII